MSNGIHLVSVHPLCKIHATIDGKWQITESLGDSGHMCRFPGDPLKFIVAKVDFFKNGKVKGYIYGQGRFATMAEADAFITEAVA